MSAADHIGVPVGVEYVLLVSRQGGILRVLQAPADETGKAGSIADLWSAPVVVAAQKAIRTTLTARQTRICNVTDDENHIAWQLTTVAQGPDRVMLIVADVQGGHEQVEVLKTLAYHDTVTGLPNINKVRLALDQVLPVRLRQEGRAAVLCLQIDSTDGAFSRLSNAHSDDVIRVLAGRLEAQVRAGELDDPEDLSRSSLIARIDFNRFCIVLPEIEGGDDAEAVARRIREVAETPLATPTGSVVFEPCVGIALFPQDGIDADALLASAQTAMEDARSLGTESFRMHSGTVRLRALHRQDLSSELRAALQSDRYSLRYLPIFTSADEQTEALEALLQWPAELNHSHSAAELISVATRTGVMPAISEWILDKAGEEFAWLKSSSQREMTLALNVSQHEYSDKKFPTLLASSLGKWQLPPGSVSVEVSEATLARDLRADYSTTDTLRDLGVNITVEQFGSGRFSFQTLASEKVDAVKLDRILLARAAESPLAHKMLVAAVALANAMNLRVIATGLETPELVEIARSLGVDAMQGFHFGKPHPIDTFVTQTGLPESHLAGGEAS
ncbi:MAG: phosphodiesterase [Pseudomonadota bacterium]